MTPSMVERGFSIDCGGFAFGSGVQVRQFDAGKYGPVCLGLLVFGGMGERLAHQISVVLLSAKEAIVGILGQQSIGCDVSQPGARIQQGPLK